jgi:Protein of unknown function (DUF3108)
MNRLLSLVLAFSLVFIVAGAAAAQLASPQVADLETGFYKLQVTSTGQTLYNMHWIFTRVSEGGKSYLVFKMKGDNNTQGEDRIDWDEESKIEETKDHGLRTLYWKKSSRGAEQMDWDLTYDWAAGRATYNFKDRATGKSENKTMKLTPDTLGGDALYLILRGFPFDKPVGYKMAGRVVSGGDLIQGDLIFRGEEKLTTPLGTFDTYKLELKPKGLVGILPTRLYMWFSKNAPHLCLRFDGFEGLQRTMTVTVEFAPVP